MVLNVFTAGLHHEMQLSKILRKHDETLCPPRPKQYSPRLPRQAATPSGSPGVLGVRSLRGKRQPGVAPGTPSRS